LAIAETSRALPLPADHGPDLLYDWDRSLYPPRWRQAAGGSLAVHILMAAAVALAPPVEVRVRHLPDVRFDSRKSTPLIAPVLPRPFDLTQKEAAKGPPRKEVTLEDLMPRPAETARNSPPPRPFVPPQPAPKPPGSPLMGEPAPVPVTGNLRIDVPEFQPPPPPPEKPKLAFELPGAPSGSPAGAGRIPPAPKQTIAEAVTQTVRGQRGGIAVSDTIDLPSGAGATISATPFQGRAGSSLELLSDPQGIDFKPYLIRVLAAVRRNWFAVIPESARFGQRGQVVIQFSISREGRVPKLVISLPSGTDSLDRAAVAGISASNPFPPLPAEFKGDQIRLQLSFAYNMPKN
jgi:TonB family protein